MGGLSRFQPITSQEITMTKRQQQTIASLKRCQRFFTEIPESFAGLGTAPAVLELGSLLHIIELCASSRSLAAHRAIRTLLNGARRARAQIEKRMKPILAMSPDLAAAWARETSPKRRGV